MREWSFFTTFCLMTAVFATVVAFLALFLGWFFTLFLNKIFKLNGKKED
jgi:F0F1-type ATP synthase assembly protein I